MNRRTRLTRKPHPFGGRAGFRRRASRQLTCQRPRWTQRRLCRLVVRLHILPFRRRCARDDDDAAGTAATAIGGISARLQTAAHDDLLAWRHHPLPRWTCVCGWYDDACYGSRHAFICRPCRSLVVTAWWLRRDAIRIDTPFLNRDNAMQCIDNRYREGRNYESAIRGHSAREPSRSLPRE